MMDAGLLGSYRSAPPNLFQDGLFSEAIDREQKALGIARDQFGDLHPSLAPILDDLGTLERTAGLYPEAEKDYRWALALRERAYGLDSEPVALSLRNLAALTADLGRLDEALLYIQKAQGILAKGPQNGLANAQCLLEWGILAREKGDLQGSESHLRDCLGMKNEALPQWLIDEELARTLLAKGENDQAEDFAEKALKHRQSLFSVDSPEVGRSLQFCGDLHLAAGSGKEKRYFEAAAKIRERMVGPDLFTNIPYLQEAGETDQALGRSKEAYALYKRVLGLVQKYYGPNHPRSAFLFERMAGLEKDLKENGKAQEDLRAAKRILEKTLGKTHPSTLRVSRSLDQLPGK
jgi:tetratricopeptide (TPR) repeat protein